MVLEYVVLDDSCDGLEIYKKVVDDRSVVLSRPLKVGCLKN